MSHAAPHMCRRLSIGNLICEICSEIQVIIWRDTRFRKWRDHKRVWICKWIRGRLMNSSFEFELEVTLICCSLSLKSRAKTLFSGQCFLTGANNHVNTYLFFLSVGITGRSWAQIFASVAPRLYASTVQIDFPSSRENIFPNKLFLFLIQWSWSCCFISKALAKKPFRELYRQM